MSDVNSMIDYNDCNDNNRYRGRRQSSISSNSVCPYASDSFCDDDDDYNDDDEYFCWDGYRAENKKLGDEDNIEDCYNRSQFLQRQQLLLPSPSSQPLVNYANVDNNQKKYVLVLFYTPNNCHLHMITFTSTLKSSYSNEISHSPYIGWN